MLLQDNVNAGLEHESVVNGNEAYTVMAVPAGLTTTGDRAIHHIIADQEEGLEKLRKPAQGTQLLELLIIETGSLQSQTGVRDGETTVQLSARHVNVEGLVGETIVS